MYTKPKPEKRYTKNFLIVNTSEQTAWEATIFSLKWIKWKIFNENYDNGTIVLKEAYVYDDSGSLKRIYHFPPKEEAKVSNISQYLKKITTDNTGSLNNISFTQENMRINLTREDIDKIKINIDYQIFPYNQDFELKNQLSSSNYIEDIIFAKIKEFIATET